MASLAAAPALAQESASLFGPSDRSSSEPDERGEQPRRWRRFIEDIRSPMTSSGIVFSAALDQRDGEPAAWGMGASGYGKRVAARAGFVLAQSSIQHSTAAMLRLDPLGDRSRCGCRNPLQRAGYAALRTFATRDSRGRAVPNLPLVVGAAGGALLARTWYPHETGPARDTAHLAGLSIVGQVGANVFREFLPDVKRLFIRER